MSAPWPTEIKLRKDKRSLAVTFDNGDVADIAAELLRVESPSAEVQGHAPDQKITVTGKQNVMIMEVQPVGLKVQDLGYRWGSCGKGDWLYFHWKTILLPAPVAEYVVVHELAHLHEPHHTPEFWLRVERAMPDYTRRKTWLAEHGMEVEGI